MTHVPEFDEPAAPRDGIPLDVHDRELFEQAHPTHWRNPQPSGRYHLVVVGAGTAGLVAAASAATLGAKVALVERKLMGGDCLNFGCVPSKALLRCARAIADVRAAERYGVRIPGGATVDFPAVMDRMRTIRARLARHDSVGRFRDLGVDVHLGEARFVATDAIEVDGQRLDFARALVATGSRPARPNVPGLAESGCLTNETVFSLRALPPRLAVFGGGPLGCELAQAFARFGSRVHLIERGERVLSREDGDAARCVQRALAADGVDLLPYCRLLAVRRTETSRVLLCQQEGRAREIAVDELLVGAGRKPNVEGLELETAGVDFDDHAGIFVDDHLRTSNPHVYAAGDVCTGFKFTHVADAMARIVVRNALFFGDAKASELVVPWCTYTDPEVAHVGLHLHEAQERGLDVATYKVELADVDRAQLDGEEDGFLAIHVRRGGDRILGATLVARHAGESIGEIAAAMTAGVGLGALARTIHPYPTQADAIHHAADASERARLTPPVRKLLSLLLAFDR